MPVPPIKRCSFKCATKSFEGVDVTQVVFIECSFADGKAPFGATLEGCHFDDKTSLPELCVRELENIKTKVAESQKESSRKKPAPKAGYGAPSAPKEDVNDEGAHVAFGNGPGASKYYCGRRLGKEAIPGSNGSCGPNNGPQCASCRRFQNAKEKEDVNDEGAHVAFGNGRGASKYYCGRRLGKEAIPGSNGSCGPNNGPQCASCRRFQNAKES